MDKTFSADVAKLYNVLMGYYMPHFLEVFNALYQVVYTFDKYCDFKDIIYDFTEYTISQGVSKKELYNNVVNNIFIITGAINNAAS